MNSVEQEKIRPQDRQIFGHPGGLWVLFTTEMWERFCYYGMRAFLVLYLCATLNSSNPGFSWSEASAYKLYGWFTGLVYLTPLLGGWIADRLIGTHKSVLLGGILIAIGEFCLFATEYFRAGATETITFTAYPVPFTLFFVGLGVLILGNGFFKPCISVMVGELYSPEDNRRDVAFTYFYMGINVGAFLAPFVAGTIAEKIGWHWGFLVACVGMIFGLCTYSFFRPKYLGHIGILDKKEKKKDDAENVVPVVPSKPLTRVEIDRVVVILVLTAFCVAFWSVFEQAGTSLNTFAKRLTNRQVPSAVATLVSEKYRPFLPNEDETDAILGLKSIRRDITDVHETLDKIRPEIDNAQYLLLSRGNESSELLKLMADYDKSIDKLAVALDSTQWAIHKATVARENAGLSPSNLSFPDLADLLEEGQKEAADIESEAAAQNKTPDEILCEREKTDEVARTKNLDPDQTIYTFPATWYQSVNPLGIVALAPLFALLWGFLARRKWEPATPVKFGMGLTLLGIAYLFMIMAARQAEATGGNAAAHWLFTTYVFCTLGELCLSPVGLSMVTRLAPKRYASLLMGVWFLSSAVAGYLSGYLAAILGSSSGGGSQIHFFFGEKEGLADYFLLMAIIPLVVGGFVFLLAPKLQKMMHEGEIKNKSDR